MKRAPHGLTLIELVVVLTAITMLALMLSPLAVNVVNDARVVRTHRDTEAIFLAIIRFSFDTGFFPQWSRAHRGGPGAVSDQVDLLVGDGNVPAVESDNLWTRGTTDHLEHQLISNAPGYAVRTPLAFGWSGPYLFGGIEADAWNNRYVVNIGLIDTGRGPRAASGATRSAVWVISAGPDGLMDTLPVQPMTTAKLAGDDIGVRVQ